MTAAHIRRVMHNLTGFQKDIDSLKATIEDIKLCDAVYPSHRLDAMPHGSGTSSPTENAAIAAVCKQQKYAVELREKLRLMRAIQSQLLILLPDSTEAKVIHLRYFSNKRYKWEGIALELCYSRHQVNLVETHFIMRVLDYYQTHK